MKVKESIVVFLVSSFGFGLIVMLLRLDVTPDTLFLLGLIFGMLAEHLWGHWQDQ